MEIVDKFFSIKSFLKNGSLSSLAAISAFMISTQFDSSFELDNSISDEMKEILKKCPSLNLKKFRPTIYLPTGYAQNIYSSKDSDYDQNIFFEVDEIDLKDEGTILLRTKFLIQITQSIKFH